MNNTLTIPGNSHIRHSSATEVPSCPQSYTIGDVVTDGTITGRVIETRMTYLIETSEGGQLTRSERDLTLAPQTEQECWFAVAAYIGVLVGAGYNDTTIRNKAYIYMGNLQKNSHLPLLSDTHESTKAKLQQICCIARAHLDWIRLASATEAS